MSIRQAEIAKTFAAWLESYTPPRNIAGKPEAMQREADRLLAVLVKFAPQEGYNGWVDNVLEQVSYQMKTRAWPTVGEIGAACSNARKDARKTGPVPTVAMDVYELNANRMKASEPVGECYLYGREAVEMIARGLVDEATMTKYRSAAFFARKKAHGEESALRWEAEAKQRHDEARIIHREKRVAA